MGSNFFFVRIRIIAFYGTEQFLETLISIIKSYDANPDKKKFFFSSRSMGSKAKKPTVVLTFQKHIPADWRKLFQYIIALFSIFVWYAMHKVQTELLMPLSSGFCDSLSIKSYFSSQLARSYTRISNNWYNELRHILDRIAW